MKREVKHIERITYTITEEQVEQLIRDYSHTLSTGTDHQGPVFSTHTLYPTTINRLDAGGYEIVTEYVTKEQPEKKKAKASEPAPVPGDALPKQSTKVFEPLKGA